MPPAPIFLSVATDETLKPVVTAITWAINIMAIVPKSPEFPTTQPNRMYMITPSMVKIDGVKTPAKVPNFFFADINNNSFWILIRL